jgi:hypothetical protein
LKNCRGTEVASRAARVEAGRSRSPVSVRWRVAAPFGADGTRRLFIRRFAAGLSLAGMVTSGERGILFWKLLSRFPSLREGALCSRVCQSDSYSATLHSSTATPFKHSPQKRNRRRFQNCNLATVLIVRARSKLRHGCELHHCFTGRGRRRILRSARTENTFRNRSLACVRVDRTWRHPLGCFAQKRLRQR